MKLVETQIAGVVVVETPRFEDERGAFMRLYCERSLEAFAGGRRIVQVNHSRSARRGTVRGLHFQHAPHAEMKFVRCLRGRVWDVAVDLRRGSPTFLKWYAETLSPQNARMMVIPEGCAHGFQVLEDDSELLYLHTAFYTPESEGGVRFDDPALGIAWPLAPDCVSQRDATHPMITLDFNGISA